MLRDFSRKLREFLLNAGKGLLLAFTNGVVVKLVVQFVSLVLQNVQPSIRDS